MRHGNGVATIVLSLRLPAPRFPNAGKVRSLASNCPGDRHGNGRWVFGAALRHLGRRCAAVIGAVTEFGTQDQGGGLSIGGAGQGNNPLNAMLGTTHTKGAVAIDMRIVDKVRAINHRGTYLCCRAVAPRMATRGAGSIVDISSTSAVGAMPLPAYGPDKPAGGNLTAILAVEFGPDNVRVDAVMPGYALTAQMQARCRRDRVRPSAPRRFPALGGNDCLHRAGHRADARTAGGRHAAARMGRHAADDRTAPVASRRRPGEPRRRGRRAGALHGVPARLTARESNEARPEARHELPQPLGAAWPPTRREPKPKPEPESRTRSRHQKESGPRPRSSVPPGHERGQCVCRQSEPGMERDNDKATRRVETC